MKVFWSWQSNTPENIGRIFVRDALQTAITEIQGEISVEEPKRDEIELDHDRKGIPGSPDLASVILNKIRETTVFVADVTPIGTTINDKPLMNANVAIELGYALDQVGDDGLLMVLNEAYGNRDTLPFDLRHKYGPILYKLPPDAPREEIERVKTELVQNLKVALKECIEAKQGGPVQNPQAHIEIPSKSTIAQYFETGAVLAERKIEGNKHEFLYETKSLLYLRIIPTKKMAELRQSKIQDLIYGIKIHPLHNGLGGGASHERNRYGGMTFSYNEKGRLLTTTQLFPNREIWGIDGRILKEDKKCIPSVAYEEVFDSGLRHYLEFAREHLQLECPLIIEAGASNVEGFMMGMSNLYRDPFWGPIIHPEIRSRHTLPELRKEAIDAVLLKVFEDFFDAVGVKRPEHFRNFPPKSAA